MEATTPSAIVLLIALSNTAGSRCDYVSLSCHSRLNFSQSSLEAHLSPTTFGEGDASVKVCVMPRTRRRARNVQQAERSTLRRAPQIGQQVPAITKTHLKAMLAKYLNEGMH